MMSMSVLLTIWLPVGLTAVAAWRILRRRPNTMDPGLRALERLLGTRAPEPSTVRVLPPRRPELRIVRDDEVA
ncbi:MAG: hypothetical protein JWN29_1742 [Acidimicrobiales bacterium]|nr:hypothetical protein [Acidimicrobiales bacterium]